MYAAKLEQKRTEKGITKDEATGKWFNPKGEVICDEYCVNRARIVSINTFHDDRSEQSKTPCVQASNGK